MMSDIAAFIGGLFMGGVFTLILGLGSVDVDYATINWADEVCKVNGSLYSVDRNGTATCENGAVFKRSSK